MRIKVEVDAEAYARWLAGVVRLVDGAVENESMPPDYPDLLGKVGLLSFQLACDSHVITPDPTASTDVPPAASNMISEIERYKQGDITICPCCGRYGGTPPVRASH
jgi:hypothetical protein